MNDSQDPGTAVDRLFDALARGDVEAAHDCLTPDATIWHGFDCVAHDRDSAVRDWAGFIAMFTERRLADVRRMPVAGGLVQQHLMVVRRAGGGRLAWPVCIVVQLRDGLIARLDEYIDRAGVLRLDEDAAEATPGMAPH